MKLLVFQATEDIVLDPELDPDKPQYSDYYKNKVKRHAEDCMAILYADEVTPSFSMDVTNAELDGTAALYCDKWLEGTGLHMSLYSGQLTTPGVGQLEVNVALSGYRLAKYRGYSGDVSGVIGEALFALMLTKKFGLNEADFAHFGTSRYFYPDFGVVCTSDMLKNAFAQAFPERQAITVEIDQAHVLPAEVKSMANPDVTIVKERIDKAFRQIKSFWNLRKKGDQPGDSTGRGPSLVFLALRNPLRLEYYYGFIIWMI